MDRLLRIPSLNWSVAATSGERNSSVTALESGRVLFFPNLRFELDAREVRFLNPGILDRSKNVSYQPLDDALGGRSRTGPDGDDLRALLRRYSQSATVFLRGLLGAYGPELKTERASLRPARVEGRVTSWRKDDTRLHVDSFPSQPTNGRRILRLFCNVNPAGEPRRWRVGEPFEQVARRFWPSLPTPPRRIDRQILSLLSITKGFRTDYDHYMLRLHDAMKANETYQRTVDQEVIDFPAGSAWACFADQVSHAVFAGQHQFEQTFSLPVEAMARPELSPLRTLARISGRELVTGKRQSRAA